jgi:hypothetical protein
MAAVFHLNPKELVMNELKQVTDAKEVELEVVDLGDATDLTMGTPQGLKSDGAPLPNNRKIA